jgi:hypothetical protein
MRNTVSLGRSLGLSLGFVISSTAVVAAQEPAPTAPSDPVAPTEPAAPVAQPAAMPMPMPMQPQPEQPAPVVAAPEPGKRVAITVSPIHLAMPIAELTVEFRPAAHIGVAVIGGYGRVSSAEGSTPMITATAYEAEVLYLHLGEVEQDLSVTAAGLVAGPYVGWKYMASVGFTFVAQLGVQAGLIRADSATASAEENRVFPLLNLNLGWAF